MIRLALIAALLVACNAGGERVVMWSDATSWSVQGGGRNCSAIPGDLCLALLSYRADTNGNRRTALTTDLRLPFGACLARINPATGEAEAVALCTFMVTGQNGTVYRVRANFRAASTTASTVTRFVTAMWTIVATWNDPMSGVLMGAEGTYETTDDFTPAS